MTESNGQERPGGAAVQATDGPAEWFLAGVRAALADLPATEVDDILADVRAHLADLAAELGSEFDRDAVVARLGDPADYAAELRTAAGYPPAPPASIDGRRGAARVAVLALLASTLVIAVGVLSMAFTVGAQSVEPAVVLLLGAALVLVALPALVREGPRIPTVAALPEVRAFRAALPRPGTPGRAFADFLASLQPTWWIVRALLAAFLATVLLAGGTDVVVTVVLAVLAVPLSIWLGRLSGRDRRLLWVVVPLNGLAAAVLMIVGYILLRNISVVSDPPVEAYYGQSGLWQDGEREILDIHPFDATGAPLTGIYLYDQDGIPIVTRQDFCPYYPDASTDRRPYPRGTVSIEPSTGKCVLMPPTSFVVAVPSPAPTLPTPAPSETGQAPPTSSPPPPTPTG